MYICMDIGNTIVHCAFCSNDGIEHYFTIGTKSVISSEVLSMVLVKFCYDNNLELSTIDGIAIASVVPSVNNIIRETCIKQFDIEPYFIDQTIKYDVNFSYFDNKHEIGADIICQAIGSVDLIPHTNLIVISVGSATTAIAVDKEKNFITGAIIPGLDMQVKALTSGAAKLQDIDLNFNVDGDIVQKRPLNTKDCIKYGIYHGHIGALREIISLFALNYFNAEQFKVIGTGGHSALFKDAGLFDLIDQHLVVYGAAKALYYKDRQIQL